MSNPTPVAPAAVIANSDPAAAIASIPLRMVRLLVRCPAQANDRIVPVDVLLSAPRQTAVEDQSPYFRGVLTEREFCNQLRTLRGNQG